jgi:hypothetical protein
MCIIRILLLRMIFWRWSRRLNLYKIPLMKFVFLSLFLMLFSFTRGQIQVNVLSEDSNLPISYATIWLSNKVYATTDSLGVFYVNESNLNSTFKVEATGFNTLYEAKVIKNNTIFLKEKLITLEEVTVNLKRKKVIKETLGKLKSGNVGIVATKDKEISRIGKFFQDNSKSNLIIDKFRFKAFSSENNRIVSVLLYSVSEDGVPNEIINNETIICKLKKGSHTSEVDLSKFNIEFPENGIFVMVNYLFLDQNKKFSEYDPNWFFYEPSLDAIIVKEFVDTWYNVNNEWQKNEKISLSFQLLLRN